VPAWLLAGARHHAALLVILTGFTLFALSNEIYFGKDLILEIPISDELAGALGIFRSSGRFFWPVGYALMAGAILLVAQHFRPRALVALLAIATMIELVDVMPLHRVIAESARHPAERYFDSRVLAALFAKADAALVFPSYGCVYREYHDAGLPEAVRDRWEQENMEIQVVAAQKSLPINSVYNARLSTDCRAENALREQPLKPGVAYIYLTGFAPAATQLASRDPADVCEQSGPLRFCLIPE
jgi:hypothetical protein